MDLTLPPEDLAWKARAKAFAETVLFPHELELETAGKLPRATKDALRAAVVEHGLNGVNHAREVGGQGCTQFQQTLINEELGKATGALWAVVWEMTAQQWSEMVDINLTGVFNTVRAALPSMVERGEGGSLVLTSSTAGLRAYQNTAHYTAAKHGVIGLARAIAQDAGPFGVTSNAVLPGWVRTAMAERSARAESERRKITVEQVWKERAAIYPQNRVLEPVEVARVIAFLCSDAAGAVNGEAITVALGGIW